MYWLIDWIVFYAVSAIFQPYSGDIYKYKYEQREGLGNNFNVTNTIPMLALPSTFYIMFDIVYPQRYQYDWTDNQKLYE